MVRFYRGNSTSEELSKYITLSREWKNTYYQEIADGFSQDLVAHIKKDTKIVNLDNSAFYFGQVEVWNAASLIDIFLNKFHPHPSEEWLVNIASIEEGYSYLYSNSDRIRHKLMNVIDIKSINHHFQLTSRLWLRKEILKVLQGYS